jgi:hypothetical protein
LSIAILLKHELIKSACFPTLLCLFKEMFSKFLEIKSETNRILKITLTKDNWSLKNTVSCHDNSIFMILPFQQKKINILDIGDIKVFSQNSLIITKLKEKYIFFQFKNIMKQSKYH